MSLCETLINSEQNFKICLIEQAKKREQGGKIFIKKKNPKTTVLV